MLARFVEAIDRGLWTPRRNSVQAELERLQNNLILDKAPQKQGISSKKAAPDCQMMKGVTRDDQ